MNSFSTLVYVVYNVLGSCLIIDIACGVNWKWLGTDRNWFEAEFLDKTHFFMQQQLIDSFFLFAQLIVEL
jgi:hypothetical protein